MFKSKKKKPAISDPINFEHRVHTGFDSEQGVFFGLPAQWTGIIGVEKERPRPIVDPSSITHTDIEPLKVSNSFEDRVLTVFEIKLESIDVFVVSSKIHIPAFEICTSLLTLDY